MIRCSKMTDNLKACTSIHNLIIFKQGEIRFN